MKALEFKSKIIKGQIQIPSDIDLRLIKGQDKDVRVIVLIEDLEYNQDYAFKQIARDQFLKGYSDSDSIYDNY